MPKVLHIGNPNVVARFTVPNEFIRSCEIVETLYNLPDEAYIAAAPDAEYIIADAIAPVSAGVIRGLPQLKMVHSEGAAYNLIDTAAAKECGVCVCNNRGLNASAVAEQAVYLMMAMLRDAVSGDRAVREGRQIRVKEAYMAAGSLLELGDCVVGLYGFGDIARETARLLRAYRTKEILYCKRNRLDPAEERELGITCCTAEELAARSDIVSLHLPVTPETACSINDAFFARMKPGAMLVNTARGELVDDAALLRALASGRVSKAALDTVSHEPVQADHPLLNSPESDKIFFAPHIGGITAASIRRGFAQSWADIETIERGGIPPRVVDGCFPAGKTAQ